MQKPLSEQQWRAQEDARTLAQAKVIQADTQRFNLAMAAADELAREQLVEARSMASVAKNFYPSMVKEGQRDGLQPGTA